MKTAIEINLKAKSGNTVNVKFDFQNPEQGWFVEKLNSYISEMDMMSNFTGYWDIARQELRNINEGQSFEIRKTKVPSGIITKMYVDGIKMNDKVKEAISDNTITEGFHTVSKDKKTAKSESFEPITKDNIEDDKI